MNQIRLNIFHLFLIVLFGVSSLGNSEIFHPYPIPTTPCSTCDTTLGFKTTLTVHGIDLLTDDEYKRYVGYSSGNPQLAPHIRELSIDPSGLWNDDETRNNAILVRKGFCCVAGGKCQDYGFVGLHFCPYTSDKSWVDVNEATGVDFRRSHKDCMDELDSLTDGMGEYLHFLSALMSAADSCSVELVPGSLGENLKKIEDFPMLNVEVVKLSKRTTSVGTAPSWWYIVTRVMVSSTDGDGGPVETLLFASPYLAVIPDFIQEVPNLVRIDLETKKSCDE